VVSVLSKACTGCTVDLDNLSDQKEMRVDLQLEPDKEENDDSTGSSSCEEDADDEDGFLIREHSAASEGTAKKQEGKAKKKPSASSKLYDKDATQTIELKIALGQFDNNNPMIDLLTGGDVQESSQSKEDEQNDDDDTDSKPSALLQVVGSKPKGARGPLITELS